MHRFIYIAVIFLTGCTMGIWSKSYQYEHIDGFYVNKERGELLVSSSKNGYIFPIDRELADTLILSRRIVFEPSLEDFSIDRENNVTGGLSLAISEKGLKKNVRSELGNLGFKPDKSGSRLTIERILQGKRYELEGQLPLRKLEQPISVRYTAPDSYAVVAGKIVATPAAITIDAAVTVPIVLYMWTLTNLLGP